MSLLRRRPMPLSIAALSLSLLAACGGGGDAAPAEPPAPTGIAFRVLPYLQQPSADGVVITWFTGRDQPAEVRVSGPGLATPLVLRSLPDRRAEMAYTDAERAETIAGLAPGSWLVPGEAFRHRVQVQGLQPGATYSYTVEQGADRFTRSFRTAPAADAWTRVRFVAMADAETEPRGRVTFREWAPGAGGTARPDAASSAWATRFGTASLGGTTVLRYAMTETDGFTRNLRIVDGRSPDFVLMPGDLVQGAGYQPAWDEFFRHTAGEFGDLFTRVPVIAAYGNWETFAALNGGYGTATDRAPVVRARHRFKTFFTGPDNGTAAHRGNYHRIDYGPVTVLTLDSTKGAPDDAVANTPTAQRLTGRQYTGPGTDTQSSFRADEYASAAARIGLFDDLSPYNEGTVQWRWVEAQLADARARGRIVFVQFHHAPYSDGEHGLPMNHAQSSGQGGTPMRAYHRLFERFGVAAVFSGHSEMFERSFVDEDGDGVGVHYFDVGVSGDGLRGERRTSNGFTEGPAGNRLQYNPFSRWSADENATERWERVGGVLQLIDGGKHYGHLEVEVERVAGATGDIAARITLTPVYSFPLLDSAYDVVATVRRTYDDGVTLQLDRQGRVLR